MIHHIFRTELGRDTDVPRPTTSSRNRRTTALFCSISTPSPPSDSGITTIRSRRRCNHADAPTPVRPHHAPNAHNCACLSRTSAKRLFPIRRTGRSGPWGLPRSCSQSVTSRSVPQSVGADRGVLSSKRCPRAAISRSREARSGAAGVSGLGGPGRRRMTRRRAGQDDAAGTDTLIATCHCHLFAPPIGGNP